MLTPALRARILSATRRKPSDGSTHWSCRKLAAALGVSKEAVHRVWQEAGLKPHRLERYMASDDPEFESKAADILGLYLRPPQEKRARNVYRGAVALMHFARRQTWSYFLDRTLAQRARCAAAILLRPATEIGLFFPLDFLRRR